MHFLKAQTDFAAFGWIWVGALAGTLMFLNVWLVIWPNQQIVLGMKDGDGAVAAAKAGLASRTNTLFSGPMLLGMFGTSHSGIAPSATGVGVMIATLVLLEINALFGKTGPMTSVKGVIHCSLGLAAVMWAVLALI